MIFTTFFYNIKPIIPRPFQIYLRRRIARARREKYRRIWPIDPQTAASPENWQGWPDNKKFAFVLSHDVDTQKGHDSIPLLLNIEKHFELKSAFNIVPERYRISQNIIDYIKKEGFELNVHGLKHDGKLFKSRKIFDERSRKINLYLKQWGSTGFTAPSMICNLQWLHDLDIDHSTCTFDTDPFEPQPFPSKTIFPFLVDNPSNKRSYVELPYTLPQDHALFIILEEKDISIWKQKLAWIVNNGGMALVNTHPDYMNFTGNKFGLEEYPHQLYIDFMEFVKSTYAGQYWHALPNEVCKYIKSKYSNT